MTELALEAIGGLEVYEVEFIRVHTPTTRIGEYMEMFSGKKRRSIKNRDRK